MLCTFDMSHINNILQSERNVFIISPPRALNLSTISTGVLPTYFEGPQWCLLALCYVLLCCLYVA